MTLLTRARKLAGPDRAIDYELYLLAGNVITNEARLSSAARIGHLEAFAPAYTASLDAIVGLIEAKLPDWTWSFQSRGGGIFKATLEHQETGVGREIVRHTAPLALVCAFLAALNPQETTP